MTPLPPFSAIRVFEAAARHQSFTRAAEELAMTQAAVSYQVRLLEDRLGFKLFERRPRQVVLTEKGRELLPAVSEAISILRAAFAAASDSEDALLRVTALPSAAFAWLLPRLPAFQCAHPDIVVTLDSSEHMADIAGGAFDLGLRSGRGDWPGLEAHVLFPQEYTPLCTPALRERFALREPADLLRAPLIGEANDPWWQRWFREAGVTGGRGNTRAAVNFGVQTMEVSAALQGLGVAMAMPIFFRAELASGALIQPFPHVVREERSYWLVHRRAKRASRKIRLFRDFLLAEAARTQAAG